MKVADLDAVVAPKWWADPHRCAWNIVTTSNYLKKKTRKKEALCSSNGSRDIHLTVFSKLGRSLKIRIR